MDEIKNNYNVVLENIRQIKNKYPDFENKFRLIAVSKTFHVKTICKLLDLGHKEFGENKLQEAEEKWSQLRKEYRDTVLHFIGPLQSNKVKRALEVFDYIHSIDREKIVKKIQDIYQKNDELRKKNPVLFVQINSGDEKQKAGVPLKDAYDFVKWSKEEIKLNISGLMCLPPVEDDPIKHFKALKELSNKLRLPFTSMGMTNDYLQAISCGATHVRIGSAIFGNRRK